MCIRDSQSPLPDLKEGEALKLEALKPDQHFTQPPSRYTEATLIKALEEKGIGRPSTYAPTISTILDREYVVKEGKNLRPTPLGAVSYTHLGPSCRKTRPAPRRRGGASPSATASSAACPRAWRRWRPPSTAAR